MFVSFESFSKNIKYGSYESGTNSCNTHRTFCCEKCENLFEIVHSIKNKLEACEECGGFLNRIPSATFIKLDKDAVTSEHNKVGDLVKSHIEETRKEIREEKKRIGSEEYK